MRGLIPVALLAVLASPGAHAGCHVNFQAQFDDAIAGYRNARVKFYIQASKSKIRGGWNHGLNDCTYSAVYMQYGSDVHFNCELDFSCAKDRQYEFLYELYDSSGKFVRSYYDHYPRNAEWTTDTDINLGNVGRFFE
jgi:hypothetical protein